jgi:glycosyltransferase involved in cell wall biosynthesis
VVAISNFVATDIATFFPEAENKIKVIYNGADKLTVKENHHPKYLPTKPFLFAIGFLSPKKNFHTLPALLSGNNYELIIAGIETRYKETILAEAKKYDLPHRVTITGTISDDDKAWYYKNCSAFLFPSIAEGFGLPVIEAMYFGKPVFLSKYTSLPEIGGDAAFYFNSFDPIDMRETFIKGIEAYEQENWKEKIMMHASKFNWDNTAKQYLALYKELIF